MFCLVTFCPIKSYLFYLQELLNKGLNSSGWIQDSLCSIIFVVGATFLMMPCVLLGSNGTDGTYFLDCRNHIRVFVCWAGLGWAGLGWAGRDGRRCQMWQKHFIFTLILSLDHRHQQSQPVTIISVSISIFISTLIKHVKLLMYLTTILLRCYYLHSIFEIN